MRTGGAARDTVRALRLFTPRASPPPPPRSGYASAKVTENVTAEIMGVVAEEARESYRAEIVHELTSDSLEDLEANAERLVSWVAQWRAERAAGGSGAAAGGGAGAAGGGGA